MIYRVYYILPRQDDQGMTDFACDMDDQPYNRLCAIFAFAEYSKLYIKYEIQTH